MIITASQTNECQFCTNSHCDLVHISDIIDEPLTVVARPIDLAPRERLAIEFTRAAMRDSNDIPASLAAELKEQFSDPELVELSFLIGFINMLNLFNNLLDVRYNGEYNLLRPPRPGPWRWRASWFWCVALIGNADPSPIARTRPGRKQDRLSSPCERSR